MAGQIPDLIATVRTGTGKGAARQARREGYVPGIVYGDGKEPSPINLSYYYLLKFLTRGVAHYQSVIESVLEREIGVAKYFSYIVIKTPFQKLHYPLGRLFGEDHR